MVWDPKDPWSRKSDPLEDALKQAQSQFKNLMPSFNSLMPSSGFRNIALAALLIFVAWNSAFIVAPDEEGVVKRFGVPVRTVGPGPHGKIPFIETVLQPKRQPVLFRCGPHSGRPRPSCRRQRTLFRGTTPGIRRDDRPRTTERAGARIVAQRRRCIRLHGTDRPACSLRRPVLENEPRWISGIHGTGTLQTRSRSFLICRRSLRAGPFDSLRLTQGRTLSTR